MEETPEGPGDEEAHEGGTGGLGDARMEAVCRRNGTRLPGLATTPEDEVIARLRDHDSISPTGSKSGLRTAALDSRRSGRNVGRRAPRAERIRRCPSRALRSAPGPHRRCS